MHWRKKGFKWKIKNITTAQACSICLIFKDELKKKSQRANQECNIFVKVMGNYLAAHKITSKLMQREVDEWYGFCRLERGISDEKMENQIFRRIEGWMVIKPLEVLKRK